MFSYFVSPQFVSIHDLSHPAHKEKNVYFIRYMGIWIIILKISETHNLNESIGDKNGMGMNVNYCLNQIFNNIKF